MYFPSLVLSIFAMCFLWNSVRSAHHHLQLVFYTPIGKTNSKNFVIANDLNFLNGIAIDFKLKSRCFLDRSMCLFWNHVINKTTGRIINFYYNNGCKGYQRSNIQWCKYVNFLLSRDDKDFYMVCKLQ